MKRLGVNIDHVATIRNARGSFSSRSINILQNMLWNVELDSVTIHLREDRRHIKDSDVVKICAKQKNFN